jgi:hypothetical protein
MTGPRRTRGLAIGAGLTAAAAVAATVILVPAGSRNAAPVSLSARQVMALVDLLTDMPVPPGVRAAAFGALASMPDVKSLGHVDGGQALLITGPPARMPPGHKLPPGAFPLGDVEVVIDPATAQVLSIITIGQTETVLSEGWTNQMPKVDPVPPKKTAPKG